MQQRAQYVGLSDGIMQNNDTERTADRTKTFYKHLDHIYRL